MTAKRNRPWLLPLVVLLAAGLAGLLAFYKIPAFHERIHPHGGAGGGASNQAAEEYTCPMHPFIRSDRPGSCPICGMTLVSRSSMAAPSPAGAPSADNTAALGMVAMNPTQRLMANVATAKAQWREFSLDTSAVGKVSWDERKVAKVSARFGGRIERLHVDFTGTKVEKGQPLLDIYSPDLVASQREYLLAREGTERMMESPYEDARRMSSALLQSSRERLKLWGVTDAQIAALEKGGRPDVVFAVFSPASGIVTERLVSAGQYVQEGTPLFSIADLSRVWVEAEIYETEIRKVPVGTQATITTEAYPGRDWKGKASFVDPFLSPETRTVKVRVELPNPGGLLKPDMFVRVYFRGKKERALTVPDTAVLVTGERAMVWTEPSPNVFEPRMIELGPRSDGYYVVRSGLKEGETVVSSAGFLIDSESQLKSGSADPHAGHGAAAPSALPGTPSPAPMPARPTSPAPVGHAGHGE